MEISRLLLVLGAACLVPFACSEPESSEAEGGAGHGVGGEAGAMEPGGSGGQGGAGEGGAGGASVTECIEVTQDIDADQVWTDHVADPELPDYCVRDDVSVLGEALLEIEPGTVVAFDAGTSLSVAKADGAALRALGTEEAPIALRGVEAEPGYWDGVSIGSDDVRNQLEHVRISDAGGGGQVVADDELDGVAAALVLDAEPGQPARASIAHCRFERNLGYGLVVEWISDVDELSECEFTGNTGPALLLSQRSFHRLDTSSRFEDNGFDGAVVTAVTNLLLDEPVSWKPLADGARYWVREPLEFLSDLTIESGVELVFGAGAGLSFPQNTTNTRAIFVVAGEEDSPVVFTAEEPTPGFWAGIEVATGHEQNAIAYADISFAENGVTLRRSGAFPPAKLSLDHVRLEGSSECGILNTSAQNTLSQSEVTFVDNEADVCLP